MSQYSNDFGDISELDPTSHNAEDNEYGEGHRDWEMMSSDQCNLIINYLPHDIDDILLKVFSDDIFVMYFFSRMNFFRRRFLPNMVKLQWQKWSKIRTQKRVLVMGLLNT